jgi:hypothetical protein
MVAPEAIANDLFRGRSGYASSRMVVHYGEKVKRHNPLNPFHKGVVVVGRGA